MFSKLVQNTVGKGEIARYEQFLLFPQCFQKACFPGASKGVIVWEWLKVNRPVFLSITSFSNDEILVFLHAACAKFEGNPNRNGR